MHNYGSIGYQAKPVSFQRYTGDLDGNYPSSLSVRLERAETVIFLDLDRVHCLMRCLGRYMIYRGINRPELAQGCNEKMVLEFIRWIWNYPRSVKPGIFKQLHD